MDWTFRYIYVCVCVHCKCVLICCCLFICLSQFCWINVNTILNVKKGSSWSWSYGSWIYNYMCNQCISPLTLWVRILLMARFTRYNIMSEWLFNVNSAIFQLYHVLDQHAELGFYSANSLKQQSADRNAAPHGYIILIPSQPVFVLSP